MAQLVIELGGSTIRAGVYDPVRHAVMVEARRETPNYHRFPTRSADQIVAALFQEIADLVTGLVGADRVDGVAVGYPGPVTPHGVALSSPTILGPALDRPVDVGALAGRCFPGCQVLVLNDLTVAGYRYVAAGDRDFCLINVGSGVGNKIFVNGRHLVGPGGRGGEMGHFVFDMSADAPLCECGGRGHLAGIASGRATQRLARQAAAADPSMFSQSLVYEACGGQAEAITTAHLVAGFHAGDHWAIANVQKAARPLAHGIAGIHAIIGLESFIVVGGFAHALGNGYLTFLRQAAAAAVWDRGQDWAAMLQMGETGDQDGLLGAGYALNLGR